MKKPHVIITAGPTYEPIDPVRGITNRSTGLMGYEIAGEAKRRGYKVTLISGPTALDPPKGVKFIQVTTAEEMKKAIFAEPKGAFCLVMAAAVSDYRPMKARKAKIKRNPVLKLELAENTDILASIPKSLAGIKVGFALESGNLIKNAKRKMVEKGLDIIVGNSIGKDKNPFGRSGREFVIIKRSGPTQILKNTDKKRASSAILDTIEKIMI